MFFIFQTGPLALPSMNTSLDYKLELYQTEDFVEKYTYPVEIKSKTNLYVQATVIGGRYLSRSDITIYSI